MTHDDAYDDMFMCRTCSIACMQAVACIHAIEHVRHMNMSSYASSCVMCLSLSVEHCIVSLSLVVFARVCCLFAINVVEANVAEWHEAAQVLSKRSHDDSNQGSWVRRDTWRQLSTQVAKC